MGEVWTEVNFIKGHMPRKESTNTKAELKPLSWRLKEPRPRERESIASKQVIKI
jgi:hypothetical protein